LHHHPIDRRELIIMMTTNELATALDTTPRALRKFLRKQGQGVGKGSRYALPSSKREVAAIQKRFNEWTASNTPTDTPLD
jgi:hypothetical protein